MKIEKVSETVFRIDGNFYSLSNQDDIDCLLCILGFTENGRPNYKKQNELIELLNDKSIEIELEEIETEDEDDFVDDFEGTDKIWDVPMPTEKSVIKNKKMNYQMLGLITLISNRKTEYIDEVDISEEEQHRYIYEKGNNSILSNKEYLETISNRKYDTIKRNLRKLAECNNDVVSYCQDEHGFYYKIMPYTVGENGKLQYVTIDSRILEYLCRASNSNVIKIYCVLLWLLWDNEKKCYIEKCVTKIWLCEQIGLTSCKNSLQTVGSILMLLTESKIINRRKETEVIKIKGENSIVKTKYYYSIPNIEQFIKTSNKFKK